MLRFFIALGIALASLAIVIAGTALLQGRKAKPFMDKDQSRILVGELARLTDKISPQKK